MKKILTVILVLGWGFLSSFSAQAISLDFVPFSQDVVIGNPVDVDLVISGLGDFTDPSLATFDLDVFFDPAILSFNSVGFGPFLGDPSLGEAITTSDASTSGSVNLFEVSFLEGDATTCVFCIPPFLNDLQPSSFTLATLTFDTLAMGTSSLSFTLNALGDANGNPLGASLGSGSVTVSGDVAVIPEPATLLLMGSGVVGLWALRKKRFRT
ncbi:MAG: PEP-CTERM sorting domain-containing protein [Nitrospira sp.]|nr:PEP-CTERM sorting domain-containing protein [Nitrospira sp.]